MNNIIITPNLVAAIASLVTACVSIFTIYMYIKHTKYLLKQTQHYEEELGILKIKLEDEKLSRQMTFHTKFQERIREVQNDINKLSIRENVDYEELDLLLNQYWSVVFDEWFICRNGGEDLLVLWNMYYEPAIIYALQNPLFKNKIEKEFNDGRSFLGLHREFKKDINELSWKANSKGLVVGHN